MSLASSQLSVAPIANAAATDHSSSFDAAFATFGPRSIKEAAAVSLLNLEANRHGTSPALTNSDDTDHSHGRHTSPDSDDACTTDDLIASEFASVKPDFNFKSLLRRR